MALPLAFAVVAAGAQGRETVTVDGQEVRILRDRYGVPHVFAPSARAIYFGNGYAVAQDRLAQLEKYRRAARGELAELVGPGGVSQDREARREGYTEEERERQFRRLSGPLREALQAYADGINAYLAVCEKNGLPPEAKKLGIPIRSWRVTDTLAIGGMMARRFGGGGGEELRNLLVLNFLKARFGSAASQVFDDLLPLNDPASPTTIPASEDRARRTQRASWQGGSFIGERTLSHSDPQLLAQAASALDRQAQMEAARRYGLPTRFGSYAMVIGPRKSASGHAMLVGGPQMGFTTPQIAHEVHLVAPGLNVIGMGFAGIPGVLIGFNEHLAWTTTSGESDAADVFVETLNPENPRQYRHRGRWLAMERRTETIAVRGSEPVTLEVFRTVHGPVIQEDTAHHLAYSQATTYWAHEGEALEGLFQFNRAASLREFAAGVERIPTMHNWFCATQEGEIGYWFGGWYPLRAEGIDTRFPTPGTGEYDWRGTRPVCDNPQLVNPKQGWLANWNNKPVTWWDHGDTPIWGEIQHVNRMMRRLGEKPLLTVDDVKAVLVDIGLNDARAAALKPILLGAARRRGEKLPARAREAVRYLEAWDDHATDGSVARALFDAWVDQARLELFADDFGPIPDPALMRQALSPSLILHAFQGKRASVRLSRDYRNGKDADTIALAALEKALAQLEEKYGPQMNTWRYRQSTIRLAPLPDIPRTDRGTYIQVVELSRPRIVGESILPPGQSEDPASPHFSDQRELASWWMFKPMLTREAEIGG